MATKKKLPPLIAALTFEVSADGNVAQLLPDGEFRSSDGSGRPVECANWRIDAEIAAVLVAQVAATTNRFVIDYEHATLHAKRTGAIGLMKIISEGGVASGIRRIEAVTGAAALAYLNAAEEQLKEAASLVKGSRENLVDKLSAVLERNRQLEKQLEQLQAKAASAAGDDLSSSAVDVKGVKVLTARLDGQDGKALLALVDQLKNKLGRAVILLGSVHEDKVVLVAGVTKDLTGQLKAGDLMKQAAAAVGGKGGGRPDMAQGGGVDAAALDAALALTVPFVEQGI